MAYQSKKQFVSKYNPRDFKRDTFKPRTNAFMLLELEDIKVNSEGRNDGYFSGLNTLGEKVRVEISDSAYQKTLERIKNGALSEEKAKFIPTLVSAKTKSVVLDEARAEQKSEYEGIETKIYLSFENVTYKTAIGEDEDKIKVYEANYMKNLGIIRLDQEKLIFDKVVSLSGFWDEALKMRKLRRINAFEKQAIRFDNTEAIDKLAAAMDENARLFKENSYLPYGNYIFRFRLIVDNTEGVKLEHQNQASKFLLVERTGHFDWNVDEVTDENGEVTREYTPMTGDDLRNEMAQFKEYMLSADCSATSQYPTERLIAEVEYGKFYSYSKRGSAIPYDKPEWVKENHYQKMLGEPTKLNFPAANPTINEETGQLDFGVNYTFPGADWGGMGFAAMPADVYNKMGKLAKSYRMISNFGIQYYRTEVSLLIYPDGVEPKFGNNLGLHPLLEIQHGDFAGNEFDKTTEAEVKAGVIDEDEHEDGLLSVEDFLNDKAAAETETETVETKEVAAEQEEEKAEKPKKAATKKKDESLIVQNDDDIPF